MEPGLSVACSPRGKLLTPVCEGKRSSLAWLAQAARVKSSHSSTGRGSGSIAWVSLGDKAGMVRGRYAKFNRPVGVVCLT